MMMKDHPEKNNEDSVNDLKNSCFSLALQVLGIVFSLLGFILLRPVLWFPFTPVQMPTSPGSHCGTRTRRCLSWRGTIFVWTIADRACSNQSYRGPSRGLVAPFRRGLRGKYPHE
ncbi:uncharacterized protein BO97DRAFT_260596 [Aspergillus homomorphus CBS 101889]|uniref:Uncharacterized protein n=1 Tax=Aspergillus homomorphus (strain CBS 101889) TaxID=1450537 RepID=A0A395I5A3_ASPHC|nr:hypothetical protein BO97DRAFT_260596 [Aspergillus homomorphus CBS 101889]RAL14919.1 hypothetical protein BO97DRAFT_260596 [Aspergillus homomorphus CBS 101889]